VFFRDFIDPVVFTFHFSCEFVLTLIFPMRCLLMFFKVIIGRDFFSVFLYFISFVFLYFFFPLFLLCIYFSLFIVLDFNIVQYIHAFLSVL
jgi:hypothetical protein